MKPSWVGKFFGEPWPSGVCEEGTQVEMPLGMSCVMCEEPIQPGDQGSFMGTSVPSMPAATFGPVHRECSLRSALGGIGHLDHHSYWCVKMHDPDGGRTYRQSALEVWDWVADHGFPTAP